MLIFNEWPNLDRIQQKDFLNYLRILCKRELVSEDKIKLFENVCIPALENYDGEISETMDTCNEVGKYGFRIHQLNDVMSKYYDKLTSPVTTKKAAQYMGISDRYVRRLAKKGVPHLEATLEKGRWFINLVSASDWLIRHQKVRLA